MKQDCGQKSGEERKEYGKDGILSKAQIDTRSGGLRVLVVCQHYFPENFQVTEIAEQLAADGFEVTALVGLPNYPQGTVPAEYKKGHRDERINGVHVIRAHEIGRGKGVFRLAVNYMSFMLSALRKAGKLAEKYDLVFVYQLSPVLMALPGIRYSRKHDTPLLLYCCDLWPESLKVYIKSEKNLLFRIMKRVSRYIYSSADRILCQSPSFADYMERIHGLNSKNIRYLPAFSEESYLEQDFIPTDNTIDFVYMGNLGYTQDLPAVLEAVKILREQLMKESVPKRVRKSSRETIEERSAADMPRFLVHFVGDGSCLEKIKKDAAEKGLMDIVKFYGRRPVEEMPEFYRLADVCLVSLMANKEMGYTLPWKVQGYMAAGKPVIGMIDGSARIVIEESGCGVCVAAGDVAGLAASMYDFIHNPGKYAGCGEAGRRYFREHFRKETFMQELESEVWDVSGRNRGGRDSGFRQPKRGYKSTE